MELGHILAAALGAVGPLMAVVALVRSAKRDGEASAREMGSLVQRLAQAEAQIREAGATAVNARLAAVEAHCRDAATTPRDVATLTQRVATLEAAIEDMVRRAVCLVEMGRLADRLTCQGPPRDRASSS